MKNPLKSIATISLMTFSALTVSSVSQAESIAPKAVERIDVQQYMGKWYEIAHLPMYFQRKCVGDTTARYSLKALLYSIVVVLQLAKWIPLKASPMRKMQVTANSK